MALREVLAELDVKVRGLGDLRAATTAIDRYVSTASSGSTEVDRLRVSQAEAAEMASRLASRIRDLQKAEGAHGQEILELRVAMFRAQDAARDYGQEIEDRLHPAVEEGIPLAVSWADAIQGLQAAFDLVSRAARVVTDQIYAVVEAGSEIDDLSQQLGVSARRLQEWSFIAEQSGTSLDTITRGLETVTRSASAGAAAYGRLGVATRGADGHLRNTEDILNDSLTALAGVSNETERAALAQQIFGRGGREMLGIVRQGPQALAELRSRFDELGGGMSDASVAAAAETGDAMNELRLAAVSLRDVLSPVVLPAVTSVIRALADGIAPLTRLGRETTLVSNLWRAGSFVLRGWEPQLRAAGMALRFFAAPWVGLALVIDDGITALDGGHSALGRWTESMLAANGHVMTFQGFLQSLRVDLLETNALLLETSAEMGEYFTPGTEYAAGLRTRADAAIGSYRSARDERDRDEAERFRSRGLIARADIIGSGGVKGATALNAARTAAAANIANNTSITITSNDPAAVGREVERVLDRRNRETADALGLAAPAGA